MKRWYVGDVMTTKVVTVAPDMPYKAVADLLVGHGLSAVPVVDLADRVLGVVSEADLLAKLECRSHTPAPSVRAAHAVPQQEGGRRHGGGADDRPGGDRSPR